VPRSPAGTYRYNIGGKVVGYGFGRRLPCAAGSNGRRYAGDFAPRAESAAASDTIFSSGKAMTAKLKVIVDAAVSRKEALRMPGRFEALHLPFSSSRRLV